MSRNPPHDVTLSLTQEELTLFCSPTWVIRVQMAVVTGKHGQPEPDIAVVLAPDRRYAKQHPTTKDIGMLVEVGDSTLLEERRKKAPIYAGGRIPWFWIVNIPDRLVECIRSPKAAAPARYCSRRDYLVGERVPVVLNGKMIGHVEVGKLFPEEAD